MQWSLTKIVYLFIFFRIYKSRSLRFKIWFIYIFLRNIRVFAIPWVKNDINLSILLRHFTLGSLREQLLSRIFSGLVTRAYHAIYKQRKYGYKRQGFLRTFETIETMCIWLLTRLARFFPWYLYDGDTCFNIYKRGNKCIFFQIERNVQNSNKELYLCIWICLNIHDIKPPCRHI